MIAPYCLHPTTVFFAFNAVDSRNNFRGRAVALRTDTAQLVVVNAPLSGHRLSSCDARLSHRVKRFRSGHRSVAQRLRIGASTRLQAEVRQYLHCPLRVGMRAQHLAATMLSNQRPRRVVGKIALGDRSGRSASALLAGPSRAASPINRPGIGTSWLARRSVA